MAFHLPNVSNMRTCSSGGRALDYQHECHNFKFCQSLQKSFGLNRLFVGQGNVTMSIIKAGGGTK